MYLPLSGCNQYKHPAESALGKALPLSWTLYPREPNRPESGLGSVRVLARPLCSGRDSPALTRPTSVPPPFPLHLCFCLVTPPPHPSIQNS